jgi:uncharacterized protein
MTDPATLSADRRTERPQWSAVLIFYLIAIGLAWAVDLPLWLSGQGLRTPFTIVFLSASMFTPAIAAVFVVLVVQRTPPRQVLVRLGWWPIRPVGRTILFAAIGLVGSALLPIVTVFVAAGLGLIHLDLVHFSGFADAVSARLPGGAKLPMPIQLLALIQLAEIPIGALINSLLTVGEETGWRGFLLPALRPLGTWPALLITGALWGLWHAPIILLGYDFNRPNLFGLALMIIGCTVYGTLVGWLRIRSGTIWPSVIAHGAFNAAGGFAALVAVAGSRIDPAIVGPLGWIAWILAGGTALTLALTHQVPPKGAWADQLPARSPRALAS